MEKIIIVGIGGHAKVIIDILLKLNYNLFGYIDSSDKGTIRDINYLGNDDYFIKNYMKYSTRNLVIGISYPNHDILSPIRKKIIYTYEKQGFHFPSIVSPDAIINSKIEFGRGVVVMDGAVINSNVKIGDFCVINTNSTIEHDCVLGYNVQVGSGAILCGNAKVEHDSFIGAGAIIRDEIIIGEDVLVGAGSVVIKDISEKGVYVGNPARRID